MPPSTSRAPKARSPRGPWPKTRSELLRQQWCLDVRGNPRYHNLIVIDIDPAWIPAQSPRLPTSVGRARLDHALTALRPLWELLRPPPSLTQDELHCLRTLLSVAPHNLAAQLHSDADVLYYTELILPDIFAGFYNKPAPPPPLKPPAFPITRETYPAAAAYIT